jgi:hypothetical protein
MLQCNTLCASLELPGSQGRSMPEPTENTMKTITQDPKSCPGWRARPASAIRAAALWHDAERWAARQARRVRRPTSSWRSIACCSWRAESLRADAASFGWRPWARAQARFWAVSMQAMHEASALSARGWRLLR